MESKSQFARCYTAGKKMIVLAVLMILSVDLLALQDWAGESWQDAVTLGELEDNFSDGDISGAHWNNQTKTLWVSDNKEEKIWSIVETSSGFSVDKSIEAMGDLEGITQAMDDSILYVLDEDCFIRSYHALYGKAITTWEIASVLPDSGLKGNHGPEGITFIPDRWLKSSGFVDATGNLFTASKHDFGGIFLVAHQNGGALYAFDLASDGSFDFIGKYDTARGESSGLAFDRSTGMLYISHNIDGNTLEITDLKSTACGDHRALKSKTEFAAPNTSNLEGFALMPVMNNDNTPNEAWAFYTDDDGNTSAGNAILVFKELMSKPHKVNEVTSYCAGKM